MWPRWQILFSLASKSLRMVTEAMTLKDACSLEGKHDKPRQCIRKQRHHFVDKGPYSQSYGFPVVMYRCVSWTIKKGEHRRVDAFELWCWRRLLGVPQSARRSNQWILKEISLEYSLEGQILKLKLQYFGCLMQIAVSLEKTLMLGKIEGRRRRGWQRMKWLDGHHWFNGLSKLWKMVKDREAWRAAVHGVTRRHDWVTEQQ